MGASDLAAALLDIVQPVIEAAHGMPVDRAFVYHGAGGRPELRRDITDGGTLTVALPRIYVSDPFPIQSGSRPRSGPSRPATSVEVRWFRCWPMRQSDSDDLISDDEGDETRAMLMADVAHAVTRTLIRVQAGRDGTAQLRAETGCREFRFVDCTPTGPGGGAAGWLWRCVASLSRAPEA